jgi:hypothetical protein
LREVVCAKDEKEVCKCVRFALEGK